MTTDELFVDPRSVTDAHGPLNSAMLTLAFARYGITFHGNATIFEDKIGDTLLYWGVYQRLSIPLQSWLSWELMNPIPKAAPRNTLSAYITQGLTNLWLGRLEIVASNPGDSLRLAIQDGGIAVVITGGAGVTRGMTGLEFFKGLDIPLLGNNEVAHLPLFQGQSRFRRTMTISWGVDGQPEDRVFVGTESMPNAISIDKEVFKAAIEALRLAEANRISDNVIA